MPAAFPIKELYTVPGLLSYERGSAQEEEGTIRSVVIDLRFTCDTFVPGRPLTHSVELWCWCIVQKCILIYQSEKDIEFCCCYLIDGNEKNTTSTFIIVVALFTKPHFAQQLRFATFIQI